MQKIHPEKNATFLMLRAKNRAKNQVRENTKHANATATQRFHVCKYRCGFAFARPLFAESPQAEPDLRACPRFQNLHLDALCLLVNRRKVNQLLCFTRVLAHANPALPTQSKHRRVFTPLLRPNTGRMKAILRAERGQKPCKGHPILSHFL